ncbi:lysylphosphatidylglycerol synthase transmembrane domain-containing protein [Bacillus sp. FJAT-29814]|uniref:lysylphosphatidylglycerol synthase transmembrane domain-containing protein n=1 Tax=Bacillus sp. FJAT-29814 TaxID=1729688 RepID=UPI00082CCE20|nr:lysylphosphatidylglycerol synthase transmembrane domain-containing protein [Bacillus sp. FJAT-29814]
MDAKSDKKGILVRIAGSTALMYWILTKIEWSKVVEVAKDGSAVYFAAAFLAIQVTVVSSILKWKMLVDSSLHQNQEKNASLSKLGRFYYIGLFFNNFLPGSVGGDVVRVFYLGRITGVPAATASVAFERLTSGGALVAIAIFSSLYIESARRFLLPLLAAIGVVIVLIWLIRIWTSKKKTGKTSSESNTNMQKWLLKSGMRETFSVALNYRKENLKWWIMIVIYSILFQVGLAWINDLLFLSLGIDIPWLELLMIITLISVITMLPVSVNGLGVREGCYVLFFREMGVPVEIAVTVSLLFFVLVSISSLAGGIFWMVERGKQT